MKTLSKYKKMSKARNALYKGMSGNFVVYIFSAMFLFMVVVMVLATLDKTVAEEGNFFLIFISQMVWGAFFIYLYRAILPTQLTDKQKGMIKGCGSISDLCMQFPATKKDYIKFSFIQWTIIYLIQFCLGIYLWIAANIFDYLKTERGDIGFIIFLIVFFNCIVEYVTIISVNKTFKFKRISYLIITIFYFILLALCMFISRLSFMDNFYNNFDIFTKFVGLVLLILVVPVMFVLTKILVFNQKGKEAWYYEDNN